MLKFQQKLAVAGNTIFICALSASLANATPSQKVVTPVMVAPGSCANINQALNSLPAEGGTVQLQEGLYICNQPVIIDHDHVTLLGAGRDKTTLRAADGKPLPVVIIGSSHNTFKDERGIPYPDHVTQDVVLRGMTIDGNFHKHPSPGEVECWNPETGESLNCGADAGLLIRNNALTIRRTQHVRVGDIEARGAFSGGIVPEKLNVDLIMDGFSATDNYFDGFAGYETTQSLFRNFDVSRNQFSGISMDWGFEGNIMELGTANDNGDNGVFSSDVGHNTFRHLKFKNNHGIGLYIAGYFDNDHGGTPLANTCDGTVIDDVTINSPKLGFNLNSPCKQTVVRSLHIVSDDHDCAWYFPGAEATVTDSTCSDGSSSEVLTGPSN